MNTTELRGIADALEIDCIAKCADEIDRLTREATAADIRIGNDAAMIAKLTAERDALIEARQEPLTQADLYMRECNRLEAERDAARAILEETSLALAKRSAERDALNKRILRLALCTTALAFEAETLTRKDEMREAIAPYESVLDEIIPEGWSLADEILVVLKGQP